MKFLSTYLTLVKGRQVSTWRLVDVDTVDPSDERDDYVLHEIWTPEEGPISHSGIVQGGLAAFVTLADMLKHGWEVKP